MQSTRMNLLLLFSRIALAPDEQALTVSQWWKLPLLREEISRVHLYSPAQLCERFGIRQYDHIAAYGLDFAPEKTEEIMAEACEKARALARTY